jgi:hypothetical protein
MVSYAPLSRNNCIDLKSKSWRYTSAFILSCLLLLPAVTLAERVDPYLVTVEITDRSTAAQRPALRKALEDVLIGLSGRALVLEDFKRQSRLPFRDSLVQQFRYLEVPGPPDNPPKLLLEVRFNVNLVRDLANQLGLPKWPLERGVTLMWVAVDTGVRRELLGELGEHQEITGAAQAVAFRRKMPLLMPLLDLDDLSQVGFSDVWEALPTKCGWPPHATLHNICCWAVFIAPRPAGVVNGRCVMARGWIVGQSKAMMKKLLLPRPSNMLQSGWHSNTRCFPVPMPSSCW